MKVRPEEIDFMERCALTALSSLFALPLATSLFDSAVVTNPDSAVDAAWRIADQMLIKRRERLEQPEDDSGCKCCGSPNWKPGGMGLLYRVCADCGTIGDAIDAATS